MKKISYARRVHLGKLAVAGAVCLLLLSALSDTLAINTYVRELRGMAVPVQSFPVKTQVLAVTFDVRADADRVGDVLKQLRSQKVKATFFLTGEWVSRHPQTAKMIQQEGHEIGRSLYTYHSPDDMTREQLEEELRRTDAAWKQAGLQGGDLFRVPYGETKGEIAKLIRSRQEQLIGWSLDVAPASAGEVKELLSSLPAEVHPGTILRLGLDPDSAAQLPDLLKRLKADGYELRTVSSLQQGVSG
jgi:peptidoglycan/xylan/chitin deacetylase (PgdA/CDA1 family)